MNVWRPNLTPKCGLITFALYTIVFVVFGVILQSSSNSVIDSGDLRYDVECDTTSTTDCSFKFNLETTIPKPVYFYYQLENFYQNQRDYVKSRDYS